jgi:short-subunit dehydrogenase
MARRVLLFGATSAIAQETAKLLQADGDRLFLVARDAGKLAIVSADLALRGPERVDGLAADLDDTARHAEIFEAAARSLDVLDTVIVAHGVLGDAEACHSDFRHAARVLHTNLVSAVSLLTLAAERFTAQGSGSIVALSSVAGDRGRASNYVYGASKGALSLFL